MALTKPALGNITRKFGPYVSNGIAGFHYGTDRGYGNGRDVYAMLNGQVTSVATLSDYGKIIVIDHGVDAHGDIIQTRYCHLSAQNVAYGAWVVAGQKIGVMGSTGTLTDQVHLHSELIKNGIRVDEQLYTAGTVPAQDQGEVINMATQQEIWANPLNYASGAADSAGVRLVKVYENVAAILAKVNTLGSGTSTPLADAEIVDEAEMSALLTTTANVINAHTTQAKNEILAAIAAISTNAPSAEYVITLTGTATPE